MKQQIPNLKTIDLTVRDIGGMGDGVGEYEMKPVFIPFTCPGDEVRATLTRQEKDWFRAKAEIIIPSPHRQPPPCEYFGQCGGCSLQHLNRLTYTRFKQSILDELLKRLGSQPEILPMVEVGAHSRRRAEFKIAVEKGKVMFGFFAFRSHSFIAVDQCLVSEPAINRLLPTIKKAFTGLKKPGRLTGMNIAVLDNGVDIGLSTRSPLHKQDISALAAFAQNHPDLHRLTVDKSCLYDNGNATVAFGAVQVELPPAAFLQASKAGQSALMDFVTRHLASCDKVIDLYSGCGTYSFPLLGTTQHISAYEGSDEMVLALHNAAQKANVSERLTVQLRDLYSSPLAVEELDRFDGIVINPPRNGALPQVERIARSNVTHVVMVSCNPATFERDGKVLLQHGYVMTHAQAIDQFYWSSHLELAAAFIKR